jgi:hypothetical protein
MWQSIFRIGASHGGKREVKASEIKRKSGPLNASVGRNEKDVEKNLPLFGFRSVAELSDADVRTYSSA